MLLFLLFGGKENGSTHLFSSIITILFQGFDLVEFAPGNDASAEAFTCAKMVYKMIAYFCL